MFDFLKPRPAVVDEATSPPAWDSLRRPLRKSALGFHVILNATLLAAPVLAPFLAFCIIACVSNVAHAGHHHETELAKQHPEFDATDIYAFRSSEPNKTVFVLSCNPKAQPGKANFGSNGLYKFHIGFDKDLKQGRTYTFAFDELGHVTIGRADSVTLKLDDGGNTIAEGEINQSLELDGGIRVWTGTAEDAFFGNSAGLHPFIESASKGEFNPAAFDGAENHFIDKFTATIVLEIPNEMLPEQVFYFATTTKQFDDHWHQVNRIGHVLLSHLYLTDVKIKDRHNTLPLAGGSDAVAAGEGNTEPNALPARSSRPSRREGEVLEEATATIARYTAQAAKQPAPKAYAAKIASRMLPDAVPYRIGTPAHYGVNEINGRRLSDDAMDTALTMLCGLPLGDSVTDSGKHQATFPYTIPASKLLPISTYADGPKTSTGLTVKIAASVDLAKEIPRADGRTLRMRHFTLAPGGKVAVHSHVDRPAVYYIISGVYTEYRADMDRPRILYPGDFSPEWGGYSHWVHNRSTTQPLVFTSADVFNAQGHGKLDYETIRRNYGLNPTKPAMPR